MLEHNSKYPRFFIFMLIALSMLMLVSIFFGEIFVGVLYFIGLIVMVVFSMLDKKYGMNLTNHKTIYFLFDIINLIAVGSILYYEFSVNKLVINLFLISLIVSIVVLILLDIFFINDKYSLKKECMFINVTQIFSMIFIFTYFFKVSAFWFVIVSFVIELFNIGLRVIVTLNQKKAMAINNSEKNNQLNDKNENEIEDLIHSNTV